MKTKYVAPYFEELAVEAENAFCSNGSINGFLNGTNDGQGWGTEPED